MIGTSHAGDDSAVAGVPTGVSQELSVLITQGKNKQSLALTRALGRRGHTVTVGSSTRLARTFASRYCEETFRYTPPEEDERAFLEDLSAVVREGSFDLLVPAGESTVVPIARERDALSRFTTVPVVDWETLQLAHDKERTIDLARRLGVPVPETYVPSSTEELGALAEDLEYPVVVKLRKGVGGVGLRHAAGPDELLEVYDERGESNAIFDYRRPLVQEHVPGTVHDVNCLFERGEPRAVLVQKRVLCSPPSGGIGVVNETVRNPELAEYATEILGHLDWHGIGQVEFVVDERDGSPKLMEINPRLWGTFELALAAGVDFPGLLCELAGNGTARPTLEYRSGVRFVWFDVPMMTSFWRSERPFARALTIARDLADGAETNLSLTDPLPMATRAIHAGTLGLRAAASRFDQR